MISCAVSGHLLTILQARHTALAAAVALGALVGPAQVGARAIEMLISRYHHPIWTMLASTILISVGIDVLWAGLPVVSAALVFYGAGIGIESIARGTLPLALFGARGYAAIMGRIAMPSLVAQSASPLLGAFLIERLGADGMLAVLLATAIIDMLTVVALFGCSRPPPLIHAPPIEAPPLATTSIKACFTCRYRGRLLELRRILTSCRIRPKREPMALSADARRMTTSAFRANSRFPSFMIVCAPAS